MRVRTSAGIYIHIEEFSNSVLKIKDKIVRSIGLFEIGETEKCLGKLW